LAWQVHVQSALPHILSGLFGGLAAAIRSGIDYVCSAVGIFQQRDFLETFIKRFFTGFALGALLGPNPLLAKLILIGLTFVDVTQLLFSSKYHSKPLEDLVINCVGQRNLDELPVPVVIPAFNITEKEPIIFCPLYSEAVPVVTVARATSAAPTFLPPAEIDKNKLIDGGVFCNDPSLSAVQYMLKSGQAQKLEDIYLLSLGTGNYKPSKIGLKEGLIGVPDLIEYAMMNFDIVPAQCQNLLFGRYSRVNPILTSNIPLDDSTRVYEATDVADKNCHPEDLNQACELVLRCVIQKKYLEDKTNARAQFREWINNMNFEWNKEERTVTAYYIDAGSWEGDYKQTSPPKGVDLCGAFGVVAGIAGFIYSKRHK